MADRYRRCFSLYEDLSVISENHVRLTLASRLMDVGFTAWFGPIGVSTIFYAMFAVQKIGLRRIWPVVSLLLLASLLGHGLSATPLSRRMPRIRRRVESEARDP